MTFSELRKMLMEAIAALPRVRFGNLGKELFHSIYSSFTYWFSINVFLNLICYFTYIGTTCWFSTSIQVILHVSKKLKKNLQAPSLAFVQPKDWTFWQFLVKLSKLDKLTTKYNPTGILGAFIREQLDNDGNYLTQQQHIETVFECK